jgi:hypothetical protein
MRAVLIIVGTALVGCAEYTPPATRTDLDAVSFELVAYPILLRDCGFVACHGDPARPFQVYGPGRSRIDPTLSPTAPPTTLEIEASYVRAVSMLSTDRDLDRSLLLSKPLATAAGGQTHGGTDHLGRNVYESRADPNYAALRAWSYGTAPIAFSAAAGTGGQ